jgi:hypothetical protein
MDEVDAFMIGVPKAGTTWLTHVLSQHPGISLSNPKEANIVASHRGTFQRTDDQPDWSRYGDCFSGEGLRIDASIHTFACPLAPARLASRMPSVLMLLCLREPVSRTVSHWRMIRDGKQDEINGADWSDFSSAWSDDRLRVDSLYGTSMARWLEHFPLDQFLIIDSQRMRTKPDEILREAESFLGLEAHSYDLNPRKHANSAEGRRPPTALGRFVRFIFSLVPNPVKDPIVRALQSRDINIYVAPLLSRKPPPLSVSPEWFSVCGDEICRELNHFESLTGFSTSHWIEGIRSIR